MSIRSPAASIAAMAFAFGWPVTLSAQTAAPFVAAGVSDPAEQMARYLRILAAEPRSLDALTGAGRVALELGDPNAAIGFYGRANDISPRSGPVKAGLAAALLDMEQARDSLRLFENAVQLGVPEGEIAGDRGLAYDIRGDNRRAQRDYQLALKMREDPIVRRRLAVSYGISGDLTDALATIEPLCRQSDRAAWRDRVFILALTGDTPGAIALARQLMYPDQVAALTPFLSRMAALQPGQKALAVHFGHFPADGRSVADAPVALADATDARAAAAAPRPIVDAMPVATPLSQPIATAGISARERRAARLRPSVDTLVALLPVRASFAGTPANTSTATPTPMITGAARVPASARSNMLATTTPPVAATVTGPPVSMIPARTAAAEIVGPGFTIVQPSTPPDASATGAPFTLQALAAQTTPATAIPAPVPVPENRPATPASAPTAAEPTPATAEPVYAPHYDKPSAPRGPSARATVPALPVEPKRVGPRSAETPLQPKPAIREEPRNAVEPSETKPAEAEPAPPKPASAKPVGSGSAETVQPKPPKPGKTAAKDIEKAKGAKATADDTDASEMPRDAKKAKSVKDGKDAKSAKNTKPGKDDSKKPDIKPAKAQESKEPSRVWVQVAGGATKGDLPKAFAALKAKNPDAYKGKLAYTTPLRFTNRLLVGPFKSSDEAQAYVNTLTKKGASGFVFTSPAGQAIEKLPGK